MPGRRAAGPRTRDPSVRPSRVRAPCAGRGRVWSRRVGICRPISMSSIVNRDGDVGPADGSFAADTHREAVGDCGAVRADIELQPVAVPLDDPRGRAGPDGGQTRADIGERLRRRERDWRGRPPQRWRLPTSTTSPVDEPTKERRRRRAELGGSRAASSRGFVREVGSGERHRREQQPDLDQDRLPVGGLPEGSERGQVQDRGAHPGADEQNTEKKATFEKRGTQTARPATRRPAQATPEHEQTDEAPDPNRARERGAASRAEEAPRGESVPRGRPAPGMKQRGSSRKQRPVRARSSETGRYGRSWRSTRSATAAGRRRGEHELEVEEAATEGGGAHERDQRGEVEGGPQRELRGRQQQVDRRRDDAIASATTKRDRHGAERAARHPANARVARSATRKTNRPIAAIIERKTIQRAVSSRGVAAVSLIEGIANWGAGPGLGPTANV